MTNIEQIAKEDWFHAKQWLILGTGPTLEQFKPEYLEQYNIWAIYCSIDVSGYADVFHYQDSHIKLYDKLPSSYRYFATRPRFEFHPERTVCIEYNCDISIAGKQYAEGQVYPCSNSTSFAFLFLTSNGVKDIHTLGIGVSSGICDKINPEYIRRTTEWNNTHENGQETWDLENATNDHWCKTYNAKWVKLDA